MNNPNTAYAVRGAACLALLLILLGLGAMATLACASLASNEWRWGAAAFDAQHAFWTVEERMALWRQQLAERQWSGTAGTLDVTGLPVMPLNLSGMPAFRLRSDDERVSVEQSLIWRPLLPRRPQAAVLTPQGAVMANGRGASGWQLLTPQDRWLWNALFGEARGVNLLRDQAAQSQPDCRGLTSASTGVVHVTGRCQLSSRVGSSGRPLLLVVEAAQVDMDATARFSGLVVLVGNTPQPQGSAFSAQHGARIDGALISEFSLDIHQSAATVHAAPEILAALVDQPVFWRLYLARNGWDQE